MAQQGSDTQYGQPARESDDQAERGVPIDPELKARRLIAILGVCTALLTLLTTALGLFALRANNQKDEAEDQVAALSSEVSSQHEQTTALEAERESLVTEIEGLQQERDALEQDLEAATDGEDPPDSDAFSPTRTYLGDGRMLGGERFSDGTGQVSGETYVHSLLGTQGYFSSSIDAKEAYAEYDLGRGYETFTATIGLSDKNHNANRTVKFEVILDNEQIYEANLTTGEAKPLSLPVAGGLRLRLQLTFFRPEDYSSSDQYDQAVWGDAALLRADS